MMLRKILLLSALGILIWTLTGCQTVQGVGKDITAVGEYGQRVLENP